MTTQPSPVAAPVDKGLLTKLLELRLWIGRLGERDVCRWWATDGLLGPNGAFVGPRVLPRTHATGRARIVFTVARHACGERFPQSTALNLFRVDPQTEDLLDALLVEKLGEFDYWAALMKRLEAVTSSNSVGATLIEAGVLDQEDLDAVESLPLGPAGRSLPLSKPGSMEAALRSLAAGFARSTPGELAVPYLDSLG